MANETNEANETVEAHVYDSYSDYAKRLAAVNRGIRFTDIRGKAYAEVNQRILAFWALFPNGRIVTRINGDNGQRADFECDVYRDAADTLPTVNAHAFEERNTNINKTSYIENGESSVVGRALGMLGIGATTAIASADEVLNAISQQEAQQGQQAPNTPPATQPAPAAQQAPATPQQQAAAARKDTFTRITKLKMQAMENGVKEEGINSWFEAKFGKVGMNRLNNAQLQETVAYLETIVRDTADGHLLPKAQQPTEQAGENGGEQ